MVAEIGVELFNACSIGGINFIVMKFSNNTISEKMMSDEEVSIISLNIVDLQSCSDEIKKYLDGL